MIVGLILREPDLGTAVSIVVIAAVMIFAAGINYRYVAGLGARGVVPALYFLLVDFGLSLAAGHGLSRTRGPIRSATASR